MLTKMVAKVFGEEPSASHAKHGAKALDISNMVLTSVEKITALQPEFALERGVSLLMTGQALKIRPFLEAEATVFPFQTEFGPFEMELIFETTQQ
jgi:hypothetical protein